MRFGVSTVVLKSSVLLLLGLAHSLLRYHCDQQRNMKATAQTSCLSRSINSSERWRSFGRRAPVARGAPDGTPLYEMVGMNLAGCRTTVSMSSIRVDSLHLALGKRNAPVSYKTKRSPRSSTGVSAGHATAKACHAWRPFPVRCARGCRCSYSGRDDQLKETLGAHGTSKSIKKCKKEVQDIEVF